MNEANTDPNAHNADPCAVTTPVVNAAPPDRGWRMWLTIVVISMILSGIGLYYDKYYKPPPTKCAAGAP
jgi:hypothetical protein